MTTDKNLTSSRQSTDADICKCSDMPPIVLQSTLTNNPIACADCNLEVSPSRLHLSDKLTSEILMWQNKFDSFYKLWLDSGDQEKYAFEQLSRPDSEVNKIGLTINRNINQTHECYYWWFVDNSDGNSLKLQSCPNCSADLTPRQNKFNADTRICRQCKIIVAD